ncbi:MAG: endonuclease [Phenylobacterium sp.]|nr:MAG: endonuclease [Phenylobacterium sp.]
MQATLDFGAVGDLREVRDRLHNFFGDLEPPPRRTPMQQLVKSLISNRTYDRVSVGAFERLMADGANWDVLAQAPARDLEARIFDVEFADRKAAHLTATLAILSRIRPSFDLDFLSAQPMDAALAWLERLPGVGRKVAASVLNFSTLQRPALVIDTHLKRVLSRLGFVSGTADTTRMYETMMQAADGWSATELTELHVWLKRLGQTHCRPHGSDCCACPLHSRCPARTAALQVKATPLRASPRPFMPRLAGLTSSPAD